MAEIVEVLVEGGKATPGNPLGPILGPMGVNIVEIVKVINEKTAAFDGMKVPVKLRIDTKTKAFEVSVGTPPTSSLVLKELGIEKGSGENRTEKVGDISLDQLKKVAAMKKDSLLGRTLKDRVLEVTGTCVSMGINVNGEDPKKAQALIKDGSWNKHFE